MDLGIQHIQADKIFHELLYQYFHKSTNINDNTKIVSNVTEPAKDLPGWKIQTDTIAGFSALLPDTVSKYPITIFNNGIDSAFIAPEAFDVYVDGSVASSNRELTTLDILKDEQQKYPHLNAGNFPPYFHIYFDTAQNDGQIESVIKDRYNMTCSLKDSRTDKNSSFSVNDSLYTYKIYGSDVGDCGGSLFIKYDTNTKRLATIRYIGQAPTLDAKVGDKFIVFDQDILNSFKFLR